MTDLMSYFPYYYENSPEFRALQEAYGPECESVRAAVEDFKAQLVLSTATWGLQYWESAFGLTPDRSLSYEARRENVRAKWRSRGVVTKEKVRLVAESFAGGEVDVQVDAQNYLVSIKFVGLLGVPANIDGLTRTLDEIIPAHLIWNYIYTYNTWGDLAPYTWENVASYTWGGVKEADL